MKDTNICCILSCDGIFDGFTVSSVASDHCLPRKGERAIRAAVRTTVVIALLCSDGDRAGTSQGVLFSANLRLGTSSEMGNPRDLSRPNRD